MQYVLTFAYTRSKYENIVSGPLFDTDEEIKNGAIDIIYASPETLVEDQDWRSSIKNVNVKVIVVDEFHTIELGMYIMCNIYMYNVRVYIAKQLNYIIRSRSFNMKGLWFLPHSHRVRIIFHEHKKVFSYYHNVPP